MDVDRTALSLERYRAIIEREYIPTLVAHEAMLIETLTSVQACARRSRVAAHLTGGATWPTNGTLSVAT
jgi:hypothetical protein